MNCVISTRNLKWLGSITILFVLTLTSANIWTSTASAAPSCYRVFVFQTGNYTDSLCTNRVAVLTAPFALGEIVGRRPGLAIYCLELTELAGDLTDRICLTPVASGRHGLFTRVSLNAAKVPIDLPVPSKDRELTGKAEGEVKFIAATAEITCKEATYTGTEAEVIAAGTVKFDFTNCTGSLGVKCTSSGDSTGTILAVAEWELVYDKLSPELLTATVFEFEKVHLECGALVSVEFKGGMLCLDLKPTEAATTHSYHCVANRSEASEKKYFVEGTEETAQLLCSINSEAFKECAGLMLANLKEPESVSADI
jgi:hypothetical protein